MHIIKKIIDDVLPNLKYEYNIDLDDGIWETFADPPEVKDGKVDFNKYEAWQTDAIKIIDHILLYHGKSHVRLFLDQLAKLEPKILKLQLWVRDHVIHAISTFIIGTLIIGKVNLPVDKSKDGYRFIWKICSSTHDLGYPLEIARNIQHDYIEQLNEILATLKSPSPKVVGDIYPSNLNILCNGLDSNEIIESRLSSWKIDINMYGYYKWLQDNNKTDHGVIGALSILKVIDAIYQKNNPDRVEQDTIVDNLNYNNLIFEQDIVDCATVLFLHNIDLSFPINKIDFNLAPIAFILVLCDTFQEWDRYSEGKKIFSGIDFDMICEVDCLSLFVPEELAFKISKTLNQRLCGFRVYVNDNLVVDR